MKKVVIDAGHGGLDSGAVNNLICEKDKVLLFAIELARIFKVIGILPILTRTEDKAITLNARIAQEIVSDADCCISCHMDAGPPNACGMTIWLHSNAPQHYIGWAQDVLDELKKIGFTSNRSLEINKGYRGDDKTDYAWNRGTRSPSMLLELGFITNTANLTEFEQNYKDYAQAVVNATCRFIGAEQTPQQPAQSCIQCREELLHKISTLLQL